MEAITSNGEYFDEDVCPSLPSADKFDLIRHQVVITKLHQYLKINSHDDDGNFDNQTITTLFNSIQGTERRSNIGGRFISYYIQRPKLCYTYDQYNNRIISLIKSIPFGVRVADDDGMLPLHYFCSYNAREIPPNLEVLALLLEAYPESPMVLNSFLETPLYQYLCLDYPDINVISCILKYCPLAATIKCKQRLPIHTLLSPRYRKDASYIENIDCIKALVKVFPESILSEVTDDSIVLGFSGSSDTTAINTRIVSTWSPFSLTLESLVLNNILESTISSIVLKKIDGYKK